MKGTGCKSYQQTVSRRTFLGAGIGSLSLPAILQARAMADVAGDVPSDTAVILHSVVPSFDFDLKNAKLFL